MSAVRECRTGGSPANFKRACACCNNPCRSSTKSRSSQFIGRICVIVRVRGIPSHVYENRKHSHCPFPSMMSGQSARLANVIIYIRLNMLFTMYMAKLTEHSLRKQLAVFHVEMQLLKWRQDNTDKENDAFRNMIITLVAIGWLLTWWFVWNHL